MLAYSPPVIRLTRPSIGEEEIDAVASVLRTGMLVQGKNVLAFEAALAERCARKHAIVVSSGTAALQLALAATEIGPGDAVLCPSLTWPSPANAIALSGAEPILVDVDVDEWNVTAAQLTGIGAKAAIVIDQFGNPLRRSELEEALSGMVVIEDAACAIGSRFDRGPCGSLGIVSCLSFHPRKIITTGEGGACLTDDDGLADTLRALRNHGQDGRTGFKMAAANYRLTDFAAAMGQVQLGRLDGIVEALRERALRYRMALPELRFQTCPDGAHANHQTMGALMPHGHTRADRDTFVGWMRSEGVEAGALSHAVHRLAPFSSALAQAEEAGRAFPATEEIVDLGFALPLFPALSRSDQDQVIELAKRGLGEVGS